MFTVSGMSPSAPIMPQQFPIGNGNQQQQPSPAAGINQQPSPPQQVPGQQPPQQQFPAIPQPQPSSPANQPQPQAPTGVQGQQLPPRPQNQPSPMVQPNGNSACSAAAAAAAGNNSEGFRAQGCNNEFYACSGGFTTKMHCPVGLFFDEDTQRCDMQDVIVACGGQKK
jgi:hypothetical protein